MPNARQRRSINREVRRVLDKLGITAREKPDGQQAPKFRWDYTLGLLGVALAIALSFYPPTSNWAAGTWLIILFAVLLYPCFHLSDSIFKGFNTIVYPILMAALFCLAVGFVIWPNRLEMYFVHPKNVEWRLSNHSISSAHDVSYWFALINIDRPDSLQGTFPYQALQIPVRKVDFINAGDTAGAIILDSAVADRVRPGDRLFGTATFDCPGCKERSYWLYIKRGEGGWFSEIRDQSVRGLHLPIGKIIANADEELERLVPSSSRKSIQ
jgi:hypothetical protein